MSMCRRQVVHPELFLRPFLFCLGFPRSSSTHPRHGTLVPPTPPSGKHAMYMCVYHNLPAPTSQRPTQPFSRLLTEPSILTHGRDAFGSSEISSLVFSALLLTRLAAHPTILRIYSFRRHLYC
ncbi:hypothetical protein CGRA01v4_07581 [Colletotrichum graminicola]|nr:hypothetical protein CGRA01v4_07581 [Colletotrichum graminicola]